LFLFLFSEWSSKKMSGEEGEKEGADLARYLEDNPDFVRRWLLENGDSKLLSALLEKQQPRALSYNNNGCSDDEEQSSVHARPMPRSKRNSVTSDLFQMLVTSPQRKSSRYDNNHSRKNFKNF
jgi:hypothetical protein